MTDQPQTLHALLFAGDKPGLEHAVIGDRCKTFSCALASIHPISDAGRLVLGRVELDREPVDALAYRARHSAAAEAVKQSLTTAPAGVVLVPRERPEPAPPNTLPNWADCEKRIANENAGNEPNYLAVTELHRFIHEYDDADPNRSSWFLYRLEQVLKENSRLTAAAPAAQVAEQYIQVGEVFADKSEHEEGDYAIAWTIEDPDDFPPGTPVFAIAKSPAQGASQ